MIIMDYALGPSIFFYCRHSGDVSSDEESGEEELQDDVSSEEEWKRRVMYFLNNGYFELK